MARDFVITVLLILPFFSPNLSKGQEQKYWFRNISVEDGLSQNTVLDIAQDSLNYMWFATPDGLNKYDGTNFTFYPVSFDFNVSAKKVRTGKIKVYGDDLWMIVRGGHLQRMALRTEKIHEYRKFYESKELIPALTDILIENDNKIWLATKENGVYLVNRRMKIISHFHSKAPLSRRINSSRINGLYRDSDGNIWILSDNGVNCLGEQEISSNFRDEDVLWVHEEIPGLSFGGNKGYQFYKVKRSEKFLKYNAPEDVNVLHFDKDDSKIWMGTWGEGVILRDRKFGDNYHLKTEKNKRGAISSNYILDIFEDSEGAIWIGTEGGGINYFDKSFRNFHFIDDQDLPRDVSLYQTRAITKDKNKNLWLASGSGKLIKYCEENNFKTVPLDSILGFQKNLRINSLYTDEEGGVWLGTHGRGIAVLNQENYAAEFFENKDLKTETIWAFLKGSNGQVWTGTQGSGLISIDKSGLLNTYSSKVNPHSAIKSLKRIDDSLIAVGYDQGGVELFNENSKRFREVSGSLNRKFENVVVNTLYYLNDWLWIGTSGKGLYVINVFTGSYHCFDQKNGFSTEVINGIVEENSRKLWISSNAGLIRLVYEKVGNSIKIEEIQQFHPENGLQGKEFIPGSHYKDNEGYIYFGGINGINYFKPENFTYKPEEIPVRINQVLIDNTPLEGDTSVVYLRSLQLSYQQNSLGLNFTAPNYLFADQFNYQYKLKGYDKQWIKSGSRKFTSYTNLPPGDYQFQVRLDNVIHKYAPVSRLAIHVGTPFWRTWWFIFLSISVILLIIYSIYRYRLNRLVEMQRVKDRISADLHDDLGSRLTSINLLSAISQNQKIPVSKVLKRIEKEVQASSEALDEIVWNIKLTDESVEEILAKMIRYAGETLENSNIEYRIIKNEDFGSVNLTMYKRRELFLLSKEILNNIVKHSKAKNVTIEVKKDEQKIVLVFTDDGRGFDPEQITHRNGLVNLRKRIKSWNGDLKISSEKNKGTRIEISVPIDKQNFLKKYFSKNTYE